MTAENVSNMYPVLNYDDYDKIVDDIESNDINVIIDE